MLKKRVEWGTTLSSLSSTQYANNSLNPNLSLPPPAIFPLFFFHTPSPVRPPHPGCSTAPTPCLNVTTKTPLLRPLGLFFSCRLTCWSLRSDSVSCVMFPRAAPPVTGRSHRSHRHSPITPIVISTVLSVYSLRWWRANFVCRCKTERGRVRERERAAALHLPVSCIMYTHDPLKRPWQCGNVFT